MMTQRHGPSSRRRANSPSLFRGRDPAHYGHQPARRLTEPMPRPAGARVDHYELVEHLADGAQAEVHRAKDLLSGDEVVIKFPHARVVDHPALAAHWRRETAL